MGLPWWLSSKESACNAEDMGSGPGLGRSPARGHLNPLQYSCLENPKEREAWLAPIHRVTKSQTRLKQLGTHTLAIFNINFSLDTNFSYKCFLLCNHSVFFSLILLRLLVAKSKLSLGKCHIELENRQVIFKYIFILISNIISQ